MSCPWDVVPGTCSTSPSVAEIKFAELRKAIEDGGVTVVDVRSRDECASNGRLPGSHCVPREKERKKEKGGKRVAPS